MDSETRCHAMQPLVCWNTAAVCRPQTKTNFTTLPPAPPHTPVHTAVFCARSFYPAEPTAAATHPFTITTRTLAVHGAADARRDLADAAYLRQREGRYQGELQRRQRYGGVGERFQQPVARPFQLCRAHRTFLDEEAREASGERWRRLVSWSRSAFARELAAGSGDGDGNGDGGGGLLRGEQVGVRQEQEGSCGSQEAAFFLGTVDDDGRVR